MTEDHNQLRKMSRRHSAIDIHKVDLEHKENVLVPIPSHFEEVYLQPEQAVAGKSRLTFGNPTPVALGGFLLANTPATIELMRWAGAGAGTGNVSAGVGTYYYCGAILLYAGAIGKWILGNAFPCVMFFTFGGFWGAFGATLTPFFNAIAANDNVAGFYNSFAMFLISMAVLCLAYMIAALRTNVCLVIILFCFAITFPCLAVSYCYAADGRNGLSETIRIAGGAFAFIASMAAWYLWFSMVFESVDFSVALLVGELSHFVKGKSDKEMEAGLV